jgi:hypothetical protein
MRCDPKIKCRMTKSITKMIDSLTPFLDQLFWRYLCFAKHFNHLSFWGYCGDNMADDVIFHKLNSILEILAIVNKWHKIPQWYLKLFSRLYHLENDGCMGFGGVRVISPESNRCWWTNSSGRGMSILAKTFEQLMLQWDLVGPHN